MPNSRTIHVNIIINTDLLMEEYPNPSKNQASPTVAAHKYLHMASFDNGGTHIDTGGQLTLNAPQGSALNFYLTSEYDNTRNPAVLYRFRKSNGKSIFQGADFAPKFASGVETIVPVQSAPFQVRYPNARTLAWVAKNAVAQAGKAGHTLGFAVYNSDLTLYGYFQSEITITVN